MTAELVNSRADGTLQKGNGIMKSRERLKSVTNETI
jgi:hypothetical protein